MKGRKKHEGSVLSVSMASHSFRKCRDRLKFHFSLRDDDDDVHRRVLSELPSLYLLRRNVCMTKGTRR
jgi:hypothetical protein